MKEAYVKFETAKLLKEKGFDWKCNISYGSQDTLIDYTMYGFIDEDNLINAPTQQMACRWLMEEKHIFIGKSFLKNEETFNLEFHSTVFNMDTGELITTIGAFCPEDAVEAAIQYVLTNNLCK